MSHACYNMTLALAAPAAKWWLRRHPVYSPLLQRFHPEVPPRGRGGICLHACSVGEVGVARPLVRALAEALPDVPVLLTVSTLSGRELAARTCPDTPLAWFPFDTVSAVRAYLKAARPRVLVLLETEVWPNILRECERQGIPTVLINGRLSDKHFKRYRRGRAFFRAAFRRIDFAGMQDQRYLERYRRITGPGVRAEVTGNIKYDSVRTDVPAHARTRARAEAAIPENAPVLVFGSTRPGDEQLAAECWTRLRTGLPSLRLVLAPRHLNRIDEALAPFSGPVSRLSARRAGGNAGEPAPILCVDTMGELSTFYAIASVAVVGGSFFPGVNGHNPLEPAALGVPTVFGPWMSNFAEPAQTLLEAGGARQAEAAQLCAVLEELLADPSEQRRMGTRARRTVLERRGAVQRNIGLIREAMEASEKPVPA